MHRSVTQTQSPALGDIRAMGAGDTIVVTPSARQRKDWARITDAIRDAVSKGCAVVWGVL